MYISYKCALLKHLIINRSLSGKIDSDRKQIIARYYKNKNKTLLNPRGTELSQNVDGYTFPIFYTDSRVIDR